MGPRARPLADDDVQLEVLHRRIEDLFDIGLKPVNLVHEKHIGRIEVGEDRRQIALDLNQRAGSRAKTGGHLVGNHRRQRGLSETGGTVEQDMIERLAPLAGRSDRNFEVFLDSRLPDIFVERLRPQGEVERNLIRFRRCAACPFRHTHVQPGAIRPWSESEGFV